MLCGVVNWSLEQHLPSRGRALSIHTLGVIHVGGGVILTEAKSIPSLNDIYLSHCALSHDDPNWLLGASHEFIETADGQASMTHEERKRKIYEESCSFVPSTILHDRISRSCKSISESYSARREYACQLGLNAGMQHLLSAPALSADQMHVCLSSGVMISTGVAPSYKMSSLPQSSPNSRRGSRTGCGLIDRDTDDTHVACLERNLNLPFRLTRNVVGVLSGYMVLGGLTVSLGLTMDACLSNKDVIEVALSLLLIRDLRSKHVAAVDCYPSVALIKVRTYGTPSNFFVHFFLSSFFLIVVNCLAYNHMINVKRILRICCAVLHSYCYSHSSYLRESLPLLLLIMIVTPIYFLLFA